MLNSISSGILTKMCANFSKLYFYVFYSIFCQPILLNVNFYRGGSTTGRPGRPPGSGQTSINGNSINRSSYSAGMIHGRCLIVIVPKRYRTLVNLRDII